MRAFIRLAVVAAATAMAASSVHAQLLEDVGVTVEGQNAVVSIRLNAQIQYLRHHPLNEGNLVQIEFQVLNAEELRTSPVEEYRKLAASDLAPAVTVEYPPQGSALVKNMVVRFGNVVKYRILPGEGNRALRVLIPLPERGAATRTPANYAINLESAPGESITQSKPIPAALQEYTVFTSRIVQDGKPVTRLNLGYFASEADAQKAQAIAAASFPQARVIRIGEVPGRPVEAEKPVAAVPVAPTETRPSEVAPAAPTAPSAAAPVPPAAADAVPAILSAAEVERRADELFEKGRAALERGESETAIIAFNELLILPQTRHAQQAQELVGQARERGGELRKARAEYDLYLKLYPDSEGATRVRQRLAALGTEQEIAAAERRRGPAPGKPGEFTTTGSFSQYYYRGATRAETLVVNATTVDKATFTGVDQSALVTNIDLTGRYRSSEYDNRLVFRDTHTLNFLKDRKNDNRLTAAYFDFKNLQLNFNGRVGRQSGNSGGVLGRFDGGLFGYSVSPQWRANVVAGAPVDTTIDSRRRFFGLSADIATFADHWSGSVYGINQTIDGITDRRALGGELRFFDPRGSAYSLIDYDTYYRKLNIGMLQGTFTSEGGLTWNLLFDQRMTPSLQSANALIGEPTSSMKTLLGTLTQEQVREQALARTAVARMLFLGVSRPITSMWQLGADFRMSNIGALPETVSAATGLVIPASPATGNVYNYSLQAIGTGLFAVRDINVINAGYITGQSYKGKSLALSNLSVLAEKWTIEPSLRFYWQHDTLDNNLRRIAPGVRVSYKWRERETFEFEGALEQTRVEGPTQSENTRRKFFSLGYRIDI